MKTKKSKLLVVLALVATFVLALSCLFITACDDDEVIETCKIEWKVATGVTAKVENLDTLPTEWVKDTELSFTLDVPEGYSASVKAYSVLTPKSGKYTFKVTRDATVTVTAEKNVKSVAVITPPAKLEYYTEDVLVPDGMVVAATYEDNTVEPVTGYTVIHGRAQNDDGVPLDTTKFKKGDTYFAVSYKGVTSETIPLIKAVDDKFGFTSVDIEVGEDGKPYYVVRGTYSDYDLESFKHVGFDFQEQGFYSEAQGGSQGWAYVKYNTSVNDEDLQNNRYVIRIDMSALANNLDTTGLTSMLFNPHMGFNNPGDNSGNLNVDTTNYEEGKSIIVSGIKYELHRTDSKDESSARTWGMVGVIVTDTIAGKYANKSVALETDGDKVYFVINGTYENYTEEQITEKLTANILADYSYNTAVTGNTNGSGDHALYYTAVTDAENEADNHAKTIYLTVDDAAKTYQVKFDISDAEEGIMFFHLSYGGGDLNGKNFKCPLSETAEDLTAELDGLKFTLVTTESTQSWATGLTGVKVESTAAAE